MRSSPGWGGRAMCRPTISWMSSRENAPLMPAPRRRGSAPARVSFGARDHGPAAATVQPPAPDPSTSFTFLGFRLLIRVLHGLELFRLGQHVVGRKRHGLAGDDGGLPALVGVGGFAERV